MNDKEQTDLLKAELLEKIGEIEVLTFKVSNLTTERDTANQEIERLHQQLSDLNDQHNAILNDRGAVMLERDKLNIEITAANESKERAWHQIDDLKKQLGEAYDNGEALNAKVEKLTEKGERLCCVVGNLFVHIQCLLKSANHTPGCRFGSCTCGKATEHSNAQIAANNYLRAIKDSEYKAFTETEAKG